MTTRRQFGPLVLALALAAPAAAGAQETVGAAPAPGGAGTPAAEPARKPRRPQRKQARQRTPPEPPAPRSAPPDTEHRLEAAPVPNRDLEAPRTGEPGAPRTRLSPSVIHRPLPSQGMAVEGANNIQEERLFFPAPGARLNVPFSY